MPVEREPASFPKPDMTPMIDCVFQLMIFFMLTLKIVAAEGNFDVNMPQGMTASESPLEEQPIKVRMVADQQGNLTKLQLGNRNLGNDDRAFDALNSEILRAIGGAPGSEAAKQASVEIDADYNLHYHHVVQAISAVRGRFDPKTKQVVSYLDKIKFAPPRRPK